MSQTTSPFEYPPRDPASTVGPPVAPSGSRLPMSAKAALGMLAFLLIGSVTFAVVLSSKLSSAHRDRADLSRSLSQARADTASRDKELAAAKSDLAAAKTDAENQAKASQQLITALGSCATGMYRGWFEISNDGDTDLAVRYFLQAEPICKQVLAGLSSSSGPASLNYSSLDLNR
jgi:hypothetical protein